jgi:hypothetical protein
MAERPTPQKAAAAVSSELFDSLEDPHAGTLGCLQCCAMPANYQLDEGNQQLCISKEEFEAVLKKHKASKAEKQLHLRTRAQHTDGSSFASAFCSNVLQRLLRFFRGLSWFVGCCCSDQKCCLNSTALHVRLCNGWVALNSVKSCRTHFISAGPPRGRYRESSDRSDQV